MNNIRHKLGDTLQLKFNSLGIINEVGGNAWHLTYSIIFRNNSLSLNKGMERNIRKGILLKIHK